MSDLPKPTGGPAFPTTTGYSVDGMTIQQASGGMTMRDYFAAKSMAALLQSGKLTSDAAKAGLSPERYMAGIAVAAYAQADAMLAERGR